MAYWHAIILSLVLVSSASGQRLINAYRFAAPAGGGAPITPTVLTSAGIPYSGSTITTASITPSANSLVLALVNARFTGTVADNIFSVTGNGLTWERVGEVTHGGTRSLAIFRAMGASPTAGPVVFTESDASDYTGGPVACVIEFANVNTTGTNGSGAVGTNTEVTSGGSAVTSLGLTITGTPDTGAATFAVYSGNDNTINLVSDALWATIQTTGPSDEVLMRSDWDNAADQSPTWTWDNTRTACAMGFIVVPSGAAPPAGAWLDNGTFAATTTDSTVACDANGPLSLGAALVPTASGTCTKVRVYFSNVNVNGTVKAALFTSDGTLLSSGSAAVSTSAMNQFYEVTLAVPQAVTASTTYHVLYMVSGTITAQGRNVTGAAGVGVGSFSSSYASFPLSSMTLFNATTKELVGMWVE